MCTNSDYPGMSIYSCDWETNSAPFFLRHNIACGIFGLGLKWPTVRPDIHHETVTHIQGLAVRRGPQGTLWRLCLVWGTATSAHLGSIHAVYILGQRSPAWVPLDRNRGSVLCATSEPYVAGGLLPPSDKAFQYLLGDKTTFHYVAHCSGFSLNLKHCPSTVWNACQRLWEQCQEVFSCGSGGQQCAMLESVLLSPFCIGYVQFFRKESRGTLGLHDLGSQNKVKLKESLCPSLSPFHSPAHPLYSFPPSPSLFLSIFLCVCICALICHSIRMETFPPCLRQGLLFAIAFTR